MFGGCRCRRNCSSTQTTDRWCETPTKQCSTSRRKWLLTWCPPLSWWTSTVTRTLPTCSGSCPVGNTALPNNSCPTSLSITKVCNLSITIVLQTNVLKEYKFKVSNFVFTCSSIGVLMYTEIIEIVKKLGGNICFRSHEPKKWFKKVCVVSERS